MGTGQIADRRDLCGSKALSSTVGYFHYLTCPQRGPPLREGANGDRSGDRSNCGPTRFMRLESTKFYSRILPLFDLSPTRPPLRGQGDRSNCGPTRFMRLESTKLYSRILPLFDLSPTRPLVPRFFPYQS